MHPTDTMRALRARRRRPITVVAARFQPCAPDFTARLESINPNVLAFVQKWADRRG